jgi:sulfoxide reductase catalytic subunit YedY
VSRLDPHASLSNYRRLRPTDESVFLRRREFVKASAALLAGAAMPGLACAQDDESRILRVPFEHDVFPARRSELYAAPPEAIARKEMTPRRTAATHNNFYEFLPGRGGPVWRHTEDFEVDDWSVEITGLCEKPMKIGLEDLLKIEHEERVYHFRCVERWAMNVPWSGFPLRKLLEKVEPGSNAKYVRFVSANKPDQMPGIAQQRWYDWPYVEALRIDEAMHDLVLMATGIYGEPLLKQHGAPVRLVCPWKYGYKNPKSIVRIELVEEKPMTFWMVQEHEYGFLSNVNPNIPHPRWSQAESYWLDSRDDFDTPIFNGYADQVAKLYPDEPKTRQAPLTEGQIAR